MAPGARDISQINLAALWASYRALGHSRLIISGVFLHLGFDKRWILAAIPDATITVIRLSAADRTLLERLDKRETGPGRNAQIERSLRQAKRMEAEPPGEPLIVATDSRSPAELACEIIDRIGWRADPPPASA